MQFKYPEILWFLLLLLIPIIIHLFQLRRFKKTPFTNVAMLQKVISESRKSNSLKKWLLLLSRMLLLACLVIAFAQPFFAKIDALKEKELVIYLDDSFSMQAKVDGVSLLEKGVQDLVQSIPDSRKFSLFTNHKSFNQVDIKQIQNELIALKPQSKQLGFENILRKSNTLNSKRADVLKQLILISDFQERMGPIRLDSSNNMTLHLVKLETDAINNTAIDSVSLETEAGQLNLNVFASGYEVDQNIPLALYNGDVPIAKTALNKVSNQATILSLPANEAIRGRLEIQDNALPFDNTFYFNVDKKPKINVLSIGDADFNFLSRIFTEDEFAFKNTSLKNLNYSVISKQNLIVLNELKDIPASLQTALRSFLNDGGSLVVIPANDQNNSSYNSFLSGVAAISFDEKITSGKKVTGITFEHPLLKDVFERKVNNFDYPELLEFFKVKGNISKVLSLENGEPFLLGGRNIYIFTSSLNNQNTDFQDSPLIVPCFYKMGLNSLKLPQPYFFIEQKNDVEVPTTLFKENLLKLKNDVTEVIPLQQSYPTKVGLTFENNPELAGIYAVMNANDTLQHLSFNHNRDESQLEYLELKTGEFASINSEIPDLFYQLAEDSSVDAYWKWFVIFALIFALVEVLIQKFLA